MHSGVACTTIVKLVAACAMTSPCRSSARLALPATGCYHLALGERRLHERGKNHPAFTLIEMLVVLTIISIIITLAVPAVSTMVRGSQLSQAAELMTSQLDFARQTALARNHSVEVRFYQYADPSVPGERQDDPATGKYRALQLFDVSDFGTPVALGKVQRLPVGIIIDSGSTLSSIIGATSSTAVAPVKNSGTTLNATIPFSGLWYNAVSFRFLPDGSTNLPGSSSGSTGGSGTSAQRTRWYLTLHSVLEGDARMAPSNNFATIQLDLANGHIRIYRP